MDIMVWKTKQKKDKENLLFISLRDTLMMHTSGTLWSCSGLVSREATAFYCAKVKEVAEECVACSFHTAVVLWGKCCM